jgi:hypothetical protein
MGKISRLQREDGLRSRQAKHQRGNQGHGSLMLWMPYSITKQLYMKGFACGEIAPTKYCFFVRLIFMVIFSAENGREDGREDGRFGAIFIFYVR